MVDKKRRDRKRRSKRSQAQLITVILIILIVIVGMLIVWNVVKPLIERTAERISLSRLKVDLKIESAYIDDDNLTVYVAIKQGKFINNDNLMLSSVNKMLSDKNGD